MNKYTKTHGILMLIILSDILNDVLLYIENKQFIYHQII